MEKKPYEKPSAKKSEDISVSRNGSSYIVQGPYKSGFVGGTGKTEEEAWENYRRAKERFDRGSDDWITEARIGGVVIRQYAY